MNEQAVAAMPTHAATFRVRTCDWAGIAAVELRDPRSGAHAIFARRGATLLDWRVPHDGELLALTDGYRSADELAAENGVRNGVLAPFPNRIADARYRFDGHAHDLLPGLADGERLIYHGFLRRMELAIAEVQEGADAASVLFSGRFAEQDFEGYPFALALGVRVSLSARGIALRVSARNLGGRTAPYAAGWHPYFRLGEAALESLELCVPAACGVLTDAKLLPVAGDAAFVPVAQAGLPDFRTPRLVGAEPIDGCYAGAAPDADGLTRSRLRDPASGRQLTIWQRGGLTHVFTGDTLARDARRAIAIEPVECMTDAFNRPECAAAIRLAPGATRSFECGADFDAGPVSSQPLAAQAA